MHEDAREALYIARRLFAVLVIFVAVMKAL